MCRCLARKVFSVGCCLTPFESQSGSDFELDAISVAVENWTFLTISDNCRAWVSRMLMTVLCQVGAPDEEPGINDQAGALKIFKSLVPRASETWRAVTTSTPAFASLQALRPSPLRVFHRGHPFVSKSGAIM